MPDSFRLERASGEESPVVVEVPHAGLLVDPESSATMIAPLRAVGRDADLYVDELFADAARHGATLLSATHSRLVLDLNRGPRDFDALAAEGGQAQALPRGLVWRLSTDGDPVLASKLSAAEVSRRLSALYLPYHAALLAELERKRERFGFAVLLCAHSMPSTGRRGHVDVGNGRADVVPGSRGRTSAAAVVIDTVADVARRRGLSVKHDDPYRGGFSTAHYGRPHEGFHAVQVELARRLYMDEATLARSDGFEATRALGAALVSALGELRL
jgi:N-formylglutamate deformylase